MLFRSSSPFSVYVVAEPNYATLCLQLTQTLRLHGIRTIYDLQHKSFKSQLKDADRNNATLAVFIGEEELNSNTIKIKDMRDGSQKSINYDTNEFVSYIKLLKAL